MALAVLLNLDLNHHIMKLQCDTKLMRFWSFKLNSGI